MFFKPNFSVSSQENQHLSPHSFPWAYYVFILQPMEINVIPITQKGDEVILMKHDKLLL